MIRKKLEGDKAFILAGQQPLDFRVVEGHGGEARPGFTPGGGRSAGTARSSRIRFLRGKWCFAPHGRISPVDTQVAVKCVMAPPLSGLRRQVIALHDRRRATNPVPLRLNSSSGDMYLGGLFGSRTPFNGDIDELIVYDRAVDGHGNPTTLRNRRGRRVGARGVAAAGGDERWENRRSPIVHPSYVDLAPKGLFSLLFAPSNSS